MGMMIFIMRDSKIENVPFRRHFNEMTSHGSAHRDRTSSSPLPLTANRPISPAYGFTPPSPRLPRYPSNERLSGSHSSASSSPPTHSLQVRLFIFGYLHVNFGNAEK